MFKLQKKSFLMIACVAAVLVIAVISVAANSDSRKRDSLLELGDRYLDEMSYEAAIATYDQVLVIDPKCEAAYIGKATAQLQMGLYEEAMETLRQGISIIGESEALTKLLQSIQDEYAKISQEQEEVQTEEVVLESNSQFLMLNYTSITRRVNSENMQIQLEVIADDEAMKGRITWEGGPEDIVTVTEDGLVTCMGKQGRGRIYASDGSNTAVCAITVTTEADEYNPEADEVTTLISGADGKKPGDYFVFELEQDGANFSNDYNTDGHYIYYSGEVVIPGNLQYHGKEIEVTGLKEWGLRWCDEMERVVIPASVRKIGESNNEGWSYSNPFCYCENLKEIALDEENENYKIVDNALYTADGRALIAYPAASAAESFMLPKDVEWIADRAFYACRNLKEILVEEGNSVYKSVDGVLIENMDTLIVYPAGREEKKYVIPEGVTRVSMGAFAFAKFEELEGKAATLYGAFDETVSNLRKLDIYSIDSWDLSSLKELRELTIRSYDLGVYSISQLEWLEKANINVSDLSDPDLNLEPLSRLKNLSHLEITADSLDMNELQRKSLEEQVKELKASNPECTYKIGDIE